MSSPIVPNVLTNVAATRALDGLQELTRNVVSLSEACGMSVALHVSCRNAMSHATDMIHTPVNAADI